MLEFDQINLSALNYILGNTCHLCRLCFASTHTKEVSLDNTITLKTNYGNENITYRAIFTELDIPSDTLLPQTLCENCAIAVVNSYLFHKLHKFSMEQWDNIINLMNINLDKCTKHHQDTKSFYFVINKSENILFESRSKLTEKTNKLVLLKFKGILKRQRMLKKRESTENVLCSWCQETFSNLLVLKKHMKQHNKFSHPCSQCPKIFSHGYLLKQHNERIHDVKSIKCNKCTEKFSTEGQLKLHIRFCHVEVLCKLCNLKFKSRKELRPHLNNHRLIECETCQKKFNNMPTFKRHVKACNNDEQLQFICDICNKVYAQKGTLQTHITTDHDFGHVLSCSWCSKRFDALSKLKSHEVKHTKEKNFQCDQCGGKFVSKAALLYHTRLHTGETPYPCDLCGQCFLSASRRMEHKKRKHFGPKEECSVCKMKFVTKHQLRKHIQRHSNPNSKLYVSST